MKIGDLVKCLTIDGRKGIIIEKVLARWGSIRYYRVMVLDAHTGPWPFQSHQLELLNESR